MVRNPLQKSVQHGDLQGSQCYEQLRAIDSKGKDSELSSRKRNKSEAAGMAAVTFFKRAWIKYLRQAKI